MKHNSYKKTKRSKLFGNKTVPTFVLVTMVAVFAFLPSGFAKSDLSPEDSCKKESSTSIEVTPKLPAEWVWQRKAMNFDHMFRTKK